MPLRDIDFTSDLPTEIGDTAYSLIAAVNLQPLRGKGACHGTTALDPFCNCPMHRNCSRSLCDVTDTLSAVSGSFCGRNSRGLFGAAAGSR